MMLPALAGFVQLPLPLRLNRAAHGGGRRFQFVKRLQPAAQAEGDDAGGEAAAADDARAPPRLPELPQSPYQRARARLGLHPTAARARAAVAPLGANFEKLRS